MPEDTKHSWAHEPDDNVLGVQEPVPTLDHNLVRWLLCFAGWFCPHGRILVRYRDRGAFPLGRGDGPVPQVTIHDLSTVLRVLRNPGLSIGETFMEGGWDVSDDALAETLGILLVNQSHLEASLSARAFALVRDALTMPFRRNTAIRSRRNASHHYDLGNDLYRLFLDEEMIYSCAFFSREARSLEAAQRNKLATTLDRLDLEPDMKVADIGCGWGAMTRAIATRGAEAVGLTLADQQLALAKDRVPPEFSNRIRYHLQDYRHHAREFHEHYDRVVSIGMFEHVGRPHFNQYFSAVRDMLKPGGRAVIHSIVKKTRSPTNAWVQKYIFPGGYIPCLADLTNAAEHVGLAIWRAPFVHEGENYANTLREWRKRFNENYRQLDQKHYDERFRRMWNFYLAGSEAAFDHIGFAVAQLVVEKPD